MTLVQEGFHRPVLLGETLRLLDPQPGATIIDGTLGGGGFADAILELVQPGGRLIGIDRDEDAISYASRKLARFGSGATLVKANFAEMRSVLERLDVEKVDGVVLDLGVSSFQLTGSPERGFGFGASGPLDGRMDRSESVTMADLVNTLSEADLADLIYRYSDERLSRRIARGIVEARKTARIETTTRLADIVTGAIPQKLRPRDIHPATRTFLALRCYLNREIESLEAGLAAAAVALRVGGRICTLTYHSIEDRVVKRFIAEAGGKCMCAPGIPVCICGAQSYMRPLVRKPVTASDEEIRLNSRARSAKLRAAEKTAELVC